MRKNFLGLLSVAVLLNGNVFAGIASDAVKYVPGGKVVQEKAEEVKIQTPAGTIVEVEFDRAGKFEEASGDSVENDVFVPGEGLLSLKDAVDSLKKAGKTPVGDWSLDSSLIRGWHYEFEGFENGKKMDYVLDAKTGKLISSEIDH